MGVNWAQICADFNPAFWVRTALSASMVGAYGAFRVPIEIFQCVLHFPRPMWVRTMHTASE